MTKEEMKNLLERRKKILEKELEKDINDSDKKEELDALKSVIWSIDKNYVDFAIRLNEYIIKNCDDHIVKLCWKNIKSDYLYLKGQQDFDKSKIISAPDQEYTEEFLQKIKDEDNIIYDTRSPFAIKIISKGNNNSPWFQIMTEDDGNLFPSKIVFDIEWAETLIDILERSIEYVKNNREEFGLKSIDQMNKEFIEEYNETLDKLEEMLKNINQKYIETEFIKRLLELLHVVPKLIRVGDKAKPFLMDLTTRIEIDYVGLDFGFTDFNEKISKLIEELCTTTQTFLIERERGY